MSQLMRLEISRCADLIYQTLLNQPLALYSKRGAVLAIRAGYEDNVITSFAGLSDKCLRVEMVRQRTQIF